MPVEAPPAPAAPKAAAAAVPAGAITLESTATPPKPAEPGSAKEKLRQKLREVHEKRNAPPQARVAPQPPPENPKIAQMEAPKGPPQDRPPQQLDRPPETPEGQQAPETGELPQNAPQGQPEKPKPNPWKLVDQWKSKTATLEREVLELKQQITPENDRRALGDRMLKLESENKELRDEIRYVNYERSPEFKEKYHEPYLRALQDTMAEFNDFQTQDANGNMRKVTNDDLMAIVTASTQQAHELANNIFGDFAGDIIAARREIRKLMSARQDALDNWKKNGEAFVKERNDRYEMEQSQLAEHIGKTWVDTSESLLKDEKFGKFFSPQEGDPEGNQKLAKGFEMADRAFNDDPREPGITPEERIRRIKRHAAVRARAAAFGRLVHINAKLEAKVAELDKALKEYKTSDPGIEGRQPAGSSAPAPPTMDSLKGKLRGLVR